MKGWEKEHPYNPRDMVLNLEGVSLLQKKTQAPYKIKLGIATTESVEMKG